MSGTRVNLGYMGRSTLVKATERMLLNLQPNLLRDPVAFDAALLKPLRFREAISALHDVVISDLKYKKRDKTAYLEWKKAEADRLEVARSEAHRAAREAALARRGEVTADLERDYDRSLKRYWKARQAYANYLWRNDPDVWRLLMPCDPVITVAPDVVFFECFSADESSYGCLTAERDGAFGKGDAQAGTTNVDYSWDLYHHFQALRSYRETRFRVDPMGFDVKTAGHAEYREEKIDLPPSWLSGFMRLQGAMAMPAKRVRLTREAVYSALVWLRRHKAHASPRALRFELSPGRTPVLALEPWEKKIVCHGSVYEGQPTEPIRVWGRQRLLVLARLLPLASSFDVYLTGSGLPSFWVARMGEMRFTLGLSGWTANDWTRASALELSAPPGHASRELIDRVGQHVRSKLRITLGEAARESGASENDTRAALDRLALTGQVIHDLTEAAYRWRQVLPIALGEALTGLPHPELIAARDLVTSKRVKLTARLEAPGGQILEGEAGGETIEALIDADGRIRRGKCRCTHHRRAGLRQGPCRHLLSLRLFAWFAWDDGGVKRGS